MADEEWCYEDSIGPEGDEECPTGGWLTGNPVFVTCRVCIERFNLKHNDNVESRCYDYGCSGDCPFSVAYERHRDEQSRAGS